MTAALVLDLKSGDRSRPCVRVMLTFHSVSFKIVIPVWRDGGQTQGGVDFEY